MKYHKYLYFGGKGVGDANGYLKNTMVNVLFHQVASNTTSGGSIELP